LTQVHVENDDGNSVDLSPLPVFSDVTLFIYIILWICSVSVWCTEWCYTILQVSRWCRSVNVAVYLFTMTYFHLTMSLLCLLTLW